MAAAEDRLAQQAAPGLSDEALETSKLLVELLHAAYATRRVQATEAGPEEATAPGLSHPTGPHAGAPAVAGHVSPHAIRAAIHVYQHGSRTVGQIAAGLGISYGWASRVVEELESAGYLLRERDATDRRVVRVRLRPAATAEVEQAFRWRGDIVERALEPLSGAERLVVQGFLRRVIDGLQAAEPGPAQTSDTHPR